MKKKWSWILGTLCYTLGVFLAIYIGGWAMLIQPIRTLFAAFSMKSLTLSLLTKEIIKIALSTTVSGFLWCLGYIGYNHFKGTEDPEWEALEQKYKAKKEDRKN